MRQRELTLLSKYFYGRKIRYESAIRRYQHSIRYREFDDVDCLELTEARHRLDELEEIRRDIMTVLKIFEEE